MNDENHHSRKQKKVFIFALIGIIAFVIALMAYDLSPVVDNTNLYGTTRTNNTVYWSNDTVTEVYIIFHSIGSGAAQNFDSNFSINGIVLEDHDFRTSASPGFHEHWYFYVRVPRGANYSIQNSTNVAMIEWREYKNR